MAKLLEADFLTVDLKAMTNHTKAANDAKAASEENTKNLDYITDWGKELKDRLEANNKLSPDARDDDYEVETKFFNDYYSHGNSSWDENTADLLNRLGEPLKKALKVVGFNPNTNPILSFVSNSWVVSNLLQTGLLNANTFKAIYNAVAKKLVAHSEFRAENDENLIYCKALYKKPVTEMLEYLQLQSNILRVSASNYSAADLTLNKKVFIYLDSVSELETTKRAQLIKNIEDSKLQSISIQDAKLNSLELAKEISSTGRGNVKIDNGNSKAGSTIKELDSIAKLFAALLAISMGSDNENAKKALLANEAHFKGLNGLDIAAASNWLTDNNIINSEQMSSSEADSLVDQICTILAKR